MPRLRCFLVPVTHFPPLLSRSLGCLPFLSLLLLSPTRTALQRNTAEWRSEGRGKIESCREGDLSGRGRDGRYGKNGSGRWSRRRKFSGCLKKKKKKGEVHPDRNFSLFSLTAASVEVPVTFSNPADGLEFDKWIEFHPKDI